MARQVIDAKYYEVGDPGSGRSPPTIACLLHRCALQRAVGRPDRATQVPDALRVVTSREIKAESVCGDTEAISCLEFDSL